MQGAVEILGMPFKKVYKADPIFEPRTFETELFMGTQNNLNVDVLESGFCPSGSLFTTFFFPKQIYPLPASPPNGKGQLAYQNFSGIC